MKKLIIYVDAGHGGVHPQTGKYMTFPEDGKKYTFQKKGFAPAFTALEGVINRAVAKIVMEKFKEYDIEFRQIHHDFQDMRNVVRCSKANDFAFSDLKAGLQPLYLSFHSNASSNSDIGQGGKGRGISFWTTKGTTESDRFAQIWFDETKKIIGDKVLYRTDLSDGDSDLEENFTVLFGTSMPAVLVENLFFDNREDLKILLSEEYQEAFAQATLNAVLAYQKLLSDTK